MVALYFSSRCRMKFLDSDVYAAQVLKARRVPSISTTVGTRGASTGRAPISYRTSTVNVIQDGPVAGKGLIIIIIIPAAGGLNYCRDAGCVHGTCTDLVQDFYCKCDSGWAGRR